MQAAPTHVITGPPPTHLRDVPSPPSYLAMRNTPSPQASGIVMTNVNVKMVNGVAVLKEEIVTLNITESGRYQTESKERVIATDGNTVAVAECQYVVKNN